QAYCRFACPTGELLHLAKSGGRHDAITRRDGIAAALLLVAGGFIFLPYFSAHNVPLHRTNSPQIAQFSGRAFGTTWSVKVRGTHDTAALEAAVSAELERVEST